MQDLSFSSPISNSGKKFAGTSFFDGYFSLSKKRYRVIQDCTVNGKKGYHVERHDIKQNIPLNILKVLSYMTIVIPIIMGIGKIIARTYNRFFIGKILPSSQETIQARMVEFQDLKNNALASLSQPTKNPSLNWNLTQEQENELLEVDKNKHLFGLKNHPLASSLPKNAKVIRGGLSHVLFLESIPGFVFKAIDMLDQKRVAEIQTSDIDVSNRARQFVTDNSLHLLYVPESRIIKLGNRTFIMQENADLISGDFSEQKGVYLSLWNDEEMADYIKTLFSQLSFFISKTGFGDVKYDNIPITKGGKIALIDLDKDSPIIGLTKGCTRGNHGLLNYIPTEHLPHFHTVVKKQLDEKHHQELDQKLETIKERALKIKKKEEEYTEFTQKNLISAPSQIINPDLPLIFFDIRKQKLAEFIIKQSNLELSNSKNLSIKEGRKVYLGINSGDLLFKKAKKLWWITNFWNHFETSILPKVLNKLKATGYVHNYKILPRYHQIKINC